MGYLFLPITPHQTHMLRKAATIWLTPTRARIWRVQPLNKLLITSLQRSFKKWSKLVRELREKWERLLRKKVLKPKLKLIVSSAVTITSTKRVFAIHFENV